MGRDVMEFTEFVATRSGALLRTATLMTGDRDLAEDLLQTVLLSAYPLLGGPREPRAAEAAVRRAMVRTLISRRKRQTWTREKVAASAPDHQFQPDGDDVETRDRMRPIAFALPSRQRAVIVLRYYEDLTESQTAAILGCSTGVTKSLTSHALHALGARPELRADMGVVTSKALEDRLRTELLEEARRVVVPAGFVTAAIANVRSRLRRRRIVAVAVVAAVAALGVGGVALDTQSGDRASLPKVDGLLVPSPPPATPFPPVLALANLQQPTSHQLAWDTLEWHDTALPRMLPNDIESAPRLSQDPVETALALVAGPGATVGVIGEDGRLRRLDGVDLAPGGELPGSGTSPLGSGSLAPNGLQAAFSQPNGVVIVDFASGSSESYDLPSTGVPEGVQSFPRTVLWQPDERHVLIGDMLLDTSDGSVEPVPYEAHRTAFAPDGAALEIMSATAPWPGEMVRWDEDKPERLPLSIICCGKTPPSATEDHLVIAASTNNVDPDWAAETGWIVLDIDTGEPLAMLRVPLSWYHTWQFGLLGWLGVDVVLIQTGQGIIAWTPDTGAIERITEVTADVSLAMDAIG